MATRDVNDELRQTIVKLVILVTFTLSSTVLTSFIILAGLGNDNIKDVYVVLNFFICLDTFVNAVFFLLQFGVYKKYYIMICMPCDTICHKCFDTASSESRKNKKYMEDSLHL